MPILLKNGSVLDIDRRSIERKDILIIDGVIEQLGKNIHCANAYIIDIPDRVVMPGLVQGHIHFCQTLFRGTAENMELLPWLENRIIPLELSHTYNSLYASSLMTCAELLLSGVTTALDMGTFSNQSAIFQAAVDTGIRICSGPSIVDNTDLWLPTRNFPNIDVQLKIIEELLSEWHGKNNGKISILLAPRFLLGIKENSWRKIVDLSKKYNILIHTHASENKYEVKKFQRKYKVGNIEALYRYGALTENTFIAHCIHLSDKEYDYISQTGAKVLHCPSANLKLASGIADVKRMLDNKIDVLIGSDGAACNNRLDIWRDIRLAGLLAKIIHGPSAIDSWDLLDMATFRSFKALGIKAGKIKKGYRADITILNLRQPQSYSPMAGNIADVIVYSAGPENVEYVIIDGEIVVENRKIKTINLDEILKLAEKKATNIKIDK